ncbi:MAG: hypothetical protein D6768_05620 [Chloroflexi bacterium]|nr:MAG: hypothetical protein D6768_05620 [Chloroflexota bacterium]
MTSKTWIIVTAVVSSILTVAVIAAVGAWLFLTPMAFAQSPMNNALPGFAGGPMMNASGPAMGNFAGRGGRMGMTNFAAGPMGQAGQGPGFVDEDGDGVCDHATDGTRPGFVDEDGDGVCDHATDGTRPGFVDEDGDGVCDHAATGGQRMGRGGMGGRWQ